MVLHVFADDSKAAALGAPLILEYARLPVLHGLLIRILSAALWATAVEEEIAEVLPDVPMEFGK